MLPCGWFTAAFIFSVAAAAAAAAGTRYADGDSFIPVDTGLLLQREEAISSSSPPGCCTSIENYQMVAR